MDFNGARIRELRERRGWSQERVAFLSGVSVATVNRAERGKHEPHADTARRLADALGVSTDSLYKEKVA